MMYGLDAAVHVPLTYPFGIWVWENENVKANKSPEIRKTNYFMVAPPIIG